MSCQAGKSHVWEYFTISRNGKPEYMATSQEQLLSAFRAHFHCYSRAIHEAIHSSADSTVLARLGDDLDEFSQLVAQVIYFSMKRTQFNSL